MALVQSRGLRQYCHRMTKKRSGLQVRKRSEIAAVDLFCGVGGKTHGFISAGIAVTAGVDTDATCAFAYEANNAGAAFHCKSVDELTVQEVATWYPEGAVRVLIGCAPCQPFSTYSYRYRSPETKSRKDERWGLLGAFGKLVRGIRPDIVSAENVPQLAWQNHKVYREFVALLDGLGYHIEEKVVKCADYGVPQTRERLVLLASLLGPIELIAPTHSRADYVTVRSAIGQLPTITAGGPPTDDPLHRSCNLSATTRVSTKYSAPCPPPPPPKRTLQR